MISTPRTRTRRSPELSRNSPPYRSRARFFSLRLRRRKTRKSSWRCATAGNLIPSWVMIVLTRRCRNSSRRRPKNKRSPAIIPMACTPLRHCSWTPAAKTHTNSNSNSCKNMGLTWRCRGIIRVIMTPCMWRWKPSSKRACKGRDIFAATAAMSAKR